MTGGVDRISFTAFLFYNLQSAEIELHQMQRTKNKNKINGNSVKLELSELHLFSIKSRAAVVISKKFGSIS